MSEIKAIETTYKEYKFRSRLEARWAYFFDLMNIRWLYEYEGYQTAYGAYVPDFWLPDVYMRWMKTPGVLFEVKPANYERNVHGALAEVAEQLGMGAVLARGFEVDSWGGWKGLIQIAPGWDEPLLFYECPCGAIKFEFPNTNYYDCPRGRKCESARPPGRDLEAFRRALTYRFW